MIMNRMRIKFQIHCRKNSFNVYKEDDTNKLREETIAYALNKVQLERDNLILALIYYKWDADNLGDGFYDDPDKNSHNAELSYPLKL